MEQVRLDVDVQSPAPRAELDEVLRIARSTCFMETMITQAVPLSARVRVNGSD